MSKQKMELVYKIDGIDVSDGVDIFEIAPILMEFGALIQSANELVGQATKIDIKVKPFKEGSWVTEFLIKSSGIDLFSSKDGNSFITVLSFLGISTKKVNNGLLQLLRHTDGDITDFRDEKNNGANEITYVNKKGEKFKVPIETHKLAQSPDIQKHLYGSIAEPLNKFPSAISISLSSGKDILETVDEHDQKILETYHHTEIQLLYEESLTKMNNVFVKPKRGSYSGEERAYSFHMGESVLWPTTIEDPDFLLDLRSGKIRLFHEDLLKVDINVIQKRDAAHQLINHYSITKLHEYIPYMRSKQLTLGGDN